MTRLIGFLLISLSFIFSPLASFASGSVSITSPNGTVSTQAIGNGNVVINTPGSVTVNPNQILNAKSITIIAGGSISAASGQSVSVNQSNSGCGGCVTVSSQSINPTQVSGPYQILQPVVPAVTVPNAAKNLTATATTSNVVMSNSPLSSQPMVSVGQYMFLLNNESNGIMKINQPSAAIITLDNPPQEKSK